MTSRRSRAVRWWRPVFAIGALVAVAFAFSDAVDDVGELQLPSWGVLGLSAALWAGGLLAAGTAWAVLLEGPSIRSVLPGFLLAQLGRYVPGSVWQALGQVLDAMRLGLPRALASQRFLLQMATQLAAAGAVAALGVLVAPPSWMLVSAAIAPAGLLFVRSGVVAWLLDWTVDHLPGRFQLLSREVPAGATLWRAVALGWLAMALMGGAFLVLLPDPYLSLGRVLGTIGVFAFAWVVGFLAVPVPAGLGVREFVLVAGLSADHGTASVLAASVLVRVVAMAVEALLAGSFYARPASLRRGSQAG